jgi:hypothetical protein
MRRHSSVHRATTKYFSNSFVFKTNIEKEGLPRGSTPDLETSAQRLVGKLTHLPGEQVLCLICMDNTQTRKEADYFLLADRSVSGRREMLTA